MSLQEFQSRFRFDPRMTLFTGVERELFITDRSGNHVPKARDVLQQLQSGVIESWARSRFTYELSACQIEARTTPFSPEQIRRRPKGGADFHLADQLSGYDHYIRHHLGQLGLQHSYGEVAPDTMPLDIYDDPSGRYRKIAEKMSREQLLRACQIIGTHVHIGMPDHPTALKVYNNVRKRSAELCEIGDKSNGRRLAIYRSLNPDCDPPAFDSWYSYYEYASENGYVDDPRRCWTLIRISIRGTIEFRMFGATDDVEEVCHWAKTCHDLCRAVMH